jgi:hypothetical protein
VHARALRPLASEDPWLDLAAVGSNLDVHDFPSLVEAHALVYRNVTRVYLAGADLGLLALPSRDERRALQNALDRLLWAAEQCGGRAAARALGGAAC